MPVLEPTVAANPIIATDVGGVPEVIGNTGVLVPPNDPRAIADAIVSLWLNPQQAQELGNRARARAKRLFSLNVCARQYKELYETLIADGRPMAP